MTKKDFTKRFKTGRRLRGQYCSLQYGPIETPEPKIAIVVQAKTTPLASGRNRIRRALSDHIGTLLNDFSRPVFVVVIVHTGMNEHTVDLCRKEVTDLLKKSGIIGS